MAITPLGGPTALLEVAGLRLLTDPTFDDAGCYPVGDRQLRKLEGPTLRPSQVMPIDAVLLSHDQHPDNLDHAGRRLVGDSPLVLTTPAAHDRLGGVTIGLRTGDHRDLVGADGHAVKITAVPARHGPVGTENLTGTVTGFLISGENVPTVYVSGDNASLDVVAEVATRTGRIDLAVLFAGAARSPLLGDAYLTLTSFQAAVATLLLGRPRTVVLHTDGWEHFTQNARTLRPAFTDVGVADCLISVEPGVRLEL